MKRAICSVGLSCLLLQALLAAPKQFAGRGEQRFVARSKKTEADEKRLLLSQLEEAARKDAIGQALKSVYGTQARFGDKWETVLLESSKRSSMFVTDSELKGAGVLGDMAMVEVSLSVDEGKLRKFIQNK